MEFKWIVFWDIGAGELLTLWLLFIDNQEEKHLLFLRTGSSKHS